MFQREQYRSCAGSYIFCGTQLFRESPGVRTEARRQTHQSHRGKQIRIRQVGHSDMSSRSLISICQFVHGYSVNVK